MSETKALYTQEISIKDLIQSPFNPRKTFSETALNELSESIAATGLQQSIVVRPVGKKWEIVDGERRYRALKMLNRDKVMVEPHDFTDQEAIEYQLMTFLQRAGITATEEANAYMTLFEKGASTEEIAAKVGKPESYIIRILRLLKLITSAKQQFDKEILPLGHALEICRLQPSDQQKALEYIFRQYEDVPCGLRDLKVFIEQEVCLDLRKITFSKTDTELVREAGPCTHCMKRTGFNQGLFPDIEQVDTCTDPACFKLKVEAHIQQEKDRLKSEDKLFIEITTDIRKPADHPNAITTRSYQPVKGKVCKYAVSGIIVDGADRGKVIPICRDKECAKHWGHMTHHDTAVAKSAEKNKSPEAIEKERIEKVKQQIEHRTHQITSELIDKEIPQKLPETIEDSHLFQIADFILNDYAATGFVNKTIYPDLDEKQLKKLKPAELIKVIHCGIIGTRIENDRYDGKVRISICKELGIDVKALTKQAKTVAQAEFAEQLKPQQST